eukprot:Nk52_evm1s1863 gene=Nk52_evmTU1s1863
MEGESSTDVIGAILRDDAGALGYLIATKGLDPNMEVLIPGGNQSGRMISIAVMYKKIECLKYLAGLGGIELDHPDACGITPVCQAILNCDHVGLHVLIQHGAGKYYSSLTKIFSETLYRPVYCAAAQGSLSCLKVLIACGYNADLPNDKGKTPAFYATANGHIDCVEFLVDNQCNIHQKDSSGRTLVHMAARYGQKEILELLLSRGVKPSERDAFGSTPLHESVSSGFVNCAKYLLDTEGCDIEAADERGRTALSYGAEKGISECVALLLKYGANVNNADNFQRLPAHFAAKNGHLKCLEFMGACGVNFQKISSCGKSPLQEAIENNRVSCQAFIMGSIRSNANCNLKTISRQALRKSLARTGDLNRLPLPVELKDYLQDERVPC